MSSVGNFGARLDRLPISSFHWRMLWLIGAGIFFDTFDVNIQASILGALIFSKWSTLHLNAVFISVTFAGIAIGAALAGALGDLMGRRFAYQFNLLLFGLISILAAAAPSMGWLIVMRGIMGIGLGAEYVVGYSLLSEFMPPAHRGRLISIVGVASMAAAAVATVIAFLVIPRFGWRWMFVIGGIGALCVWYLRKRLPESPRWLESVGRHDEAERVTQAIEQEVARSVALPPVPEAAPAGQISKIPFSVLFTKPVIRRTLVVMLINIVVGAGAYGFINWIPTFFVKQGLGITKSLGFAAIINFAGIAGALLAVWWADKIGRKYGIVLAALAAAIFGSVFPFVTSEAAIVTLCFLMVAVILLILTLGIGSYGPELFPTEYRMRGNGVTQFAGRLASIATPFAVVPLFRSFGMAGVVGALAILFLILALIVAIFGIETRKKPLETLKPGSAEFAVST